MSFCNKSTYNTALYGNGFTSICSAVNFLFNSFLSVLLIIIYKMMFKGHSAQYSLQLSYSNDICWCGADNISQIFLL